MNWIREPNTEPIPGYRLIEPLGSGGFGEVWKCEAPGGIFKAIKFVYGNLQSLDVDSIRAEQEKNALERIKEVRHPFVCSLERWEFVEGELIIVMELAERTLHDHFVECQNAGLIGIPRDSLLRFLRDAAEALDFINEKHKLQHLDVKPRNLFLTSERVKVGDFGLVKNLERTSHWGLLGGVTPLYAPPETYSGKISRHCDQYSLAIVYQELLTGHRPFNGKNVRQLAQQHMQEPPDLRSLPEAERPIVARALAKKPEDRFPSCMSFIASVYKARQPVKIELPVKDGAFADLMRPKTMAETMEDVQLEEYALDAAVAVAEPPRPKSKSKAAIDLDDPNIEVADMGVTIAQPDTGAIRPTIIIGLGSFGRRALLELRCRFLDRFGDLSKVPILRFLCIDPDPQAVNQAIRGAPEVALTRNEFYHLPLQPVSNYRRRNLEVLSEWLPREKLYSMPRSMQTQGARSLGRLAFADNQQRLLARVRREIEEATNPDNIYQSVTATGLALRDSKPRVYVLAAAGGGTSGMLPDLGYALRRLLDQLRHPDSKVHSYLLCGAPQDPATPKAELANVYATLTELNHFCDPMIAFAAQYGVDGQRLVDQGQPFHSMYLLPLAHRTPEALDESVSHLGNYLFHELTTPLGLRLEHMRGQDDLGESGGAQHGGISPAPLRSFGTYSIWFPRGLLLRLAARHACRRLIEGWMTNGAESVTEEIQAEIAKFITRVNTDPALKSEALTRQVESMANAGSPTDAGTTPGEVLAGLLAKLEEQLLQPVAQEDPSNWAKQALTRVREFVGAGVDEGEINDWRKTRLTRALSAASMKVAEDWDRKLSKDLFGLMENNGARVAAAELALDKIQGFCHLSIDQQRQLLDQHSAKTLQAWRQVEAALTECANSSGGFRFFGGRSRTRQLRNFMDAVAHFARQRLAEELIAAVRHTFSLLSARLAERGRDMGFCRQRLRHLLESLESGPVDSDEDMTSTRSGDYTLTRSPLPSTESFWEGIRQSATARVVLPEGEVDLERASLRFLQRLLPDQWNTLDKELHDRVLLPRGGLHGACNSGDLIRQVSDPLLEEASNFLGHHLPIMDVAQILGMEFHCLDAEGKQKEPDNAEELTRQTQDYIDRAIPLIQGKLEAKQAAFLLLPASPAGRALGKALSQLFPDLRLVSVPGQSDLMICREQGCLTVADIQKLLKPCRAAFEALASSIPTSPHSRFDILDWLPLNP